jgi:hypothetical protein
MGAWVALQKLRKSLGDADFEDLCRRRQVATDDDLDPSLSAGTVALTSLTTRSDTPLTST